MLLHGGGKDPFLTKPLRRDSRIATHRGNIEQNKIIGKQVRDAIKTDKGGENNRTPVC